MFLVKLVFVHTPNISGHLYLYYFAQHKEVDNNKLLYYTELASTE